MKKKRATLLKDIIYKAYGLVRFSKLLSLGEAINSISSIKLGVDTGLIGNISDATLFSLLYKIQPAHLEYVLKNSAFNFENDIELDTQYRINRLRALILQEAFESLEIKE